MPNGQGGQALGRQTSGVLSASWRPCSSSAVEAVQPQVGSEGKLCDVNVGERRRQTSTLAAHVRMHDWAAYRRRLLQLNFPLLLACYSQAWCLLLLALISRQPTSAYRSQRLGAGEGSTDRRAGEEQSEAAGEALRV